MSTATQSPPPASSPTTATANNVTYIRYNGLYVHTVPGQLKLVCLVLNLIAFICLQMSAFSNTSRGAFFCFVSMFGFWFTGILFVLYLFQVVYKVTRIPWLQIEMWFCAGMTLAYMLASSLAAATRWEAYVAAAFFGFIAMIAYGYDAFLKWRTMREATVTVVRTTTTTTVTQVA